MRVFAGRSALVLIVLAIPLAGCGIRTSQQSGPSTEVTEKETTPMPDPVADGTAASGTEITLHVEGMV